MSATQTIVDAFERMLNDGAPCMAEPCDGCPINADGTYDGVSCKSTFAKLLLASRSEPWGARVEDFRGRRYCSLCGGPLEDGAGECPTCGAIVARGAEARSDGRYDVSVSPYQKNSETSRETARESLAGGAAIR